jgi:hypothetical protein
MQKAIIRNTQRSIYRSKYFDMQIANIVIMTVDCIAFLIAAIFVIKTALFFRFEKEWDPIGFFYYPKPALKITCIRELKVWRQRQNYLSAIFLILILLFAFLVTFKLLIFSYPAY